MIIRPGLGALDGVMANLSEQTRAEAAAAGIEIGQIPARLRAFAFQNVAHSFFFDDAPAAVLAVRVIDEGGDTFLIAADGFFEQSVKHRRALREHISGLIEWFGTIHTVTRSNHPNMPRWLKMLGYEPHPSFENLYRWG